MKDNRITYTVTNRIQITHIEWERIFLKIYIRSENDAPLDFYLVRFILPDEDTRTQNSENATVDLICQIPLNTVIPTDDGYMIRINMAAANGRHFLENGRYRFMAVDTEKDSYYMCSILAEEALNINSKCMIFPYAHKKYSYEVLFRIETAIADTMTLLMYSRFMIENQKWKERYLLRDRRTMEGKFRCFVKKFKLDLMQLTYNIVSMFTVKKGDRILFLTETKPYLWGNLKYIDDRIKERGLDKEYELSYRLRLGVGKHKGLTSWFKMIVALAKSDYIFVDDYVPIFNSLKLDDKTQLIQVWHAGEGFKSVGYSRFGKAASPHPYRNGYKSFTYAITGSERLVHVYSEVFGIPEEYILPLGMARLDGYLEPETVKTKTEDFYKQYPKCKDKKIILFSPTFRGDSQKLAFYDYDRLDMQQIYDFCGDEYIWAFKMHPFVKEKPPISKKHKDRIIDLSKWENINDLYYVCDIMITDYSSAYYEYSIFERPILFFTYDRIDYEIRRGVHKPVKESAPGKVCDSFDELMSALRNKDYDIEKTRMFKQENFGNYDGKAADRIIDTILLQGKSENVN